MAQKSELTMGVAVLLLPGALYRWVRYGQGMMAVKAPIKGTAWDSGRILFWNLLIGGPLFLVLEFFMMGRPALGTVLVLSYLASVLDSPFLGLVDRRALTRGFPLADALRSIPCADKRRGLTVQRHVSLRVAGDPPVNGWLLGYRCYPEGDMLVSLQGDDGRVIQQKVSASDNFRLTS